ncbi:MAG: hypothetical protein K5985_05335 [Lachnospiraceae bacterium]|nr:hypothetical protein [Lachnospiraceae bacterium]
MVYAPVGKRAKVPYYMESAGINLFSIEELGYYLYESVFLLDRSLMKSELVRFIERELELPVLADMLNHILLVEGSLSSFVVCILRYLNYCSEAQLAIVEKSLSEGYAEGNMHRRRIRGDKHVKAGRYLDAIREYTFAESALTDEVPVEETARLYHNMGVAYARMFLFEQAADYFKRSCDLSYNQKAYTSYLSAKRMVMTPGDYLEFVRSEHADPELINAIEAKLNSSITALKDRGDYRLYMRLKRKKHEGDIAGYREDMRALLSSFENDYRKNMGNL